MTWIAARLLLSKVGTALKPFLPWILLALGVGALLYGFHSWGYRDGVAHEQPKIAKLTKQRTTLLASLGGLTAATGRMVASVDAFTAVQAKRQAAGQDALRKAREREQRLASGIAALEAAGRSTGLRTPCPVSKINREALDAL